MQRRRHRLRPARSRQRRRVRFDELANLPFAENRPTKETAQTLRDELLFQRATQTYLWAMPLINTLGMQVGSEKVFGAGYNVLPIWKKRLDAKTLVTTPNSDVIYAMSYVDLGKDGPLVLEAPPELQGILLDLLAAPHPGRWRQVLWRCRPARTGWRQGRQVPAAAARLQGRGAGRLLRLPFGDEQRLRLPACVLPGPEEPDAGRRSTSSRSKIYPLNGEAGAKPMQFPDASGVPANMLPISDGSAFDQLKQLVDSEGDNLAESDSLGMLAAIGIVKGQPFNPDAHTRDDPRSGREDRLQDEPRHRLSRSRQRPVFRVYPDRHWLNPIADGDAGKSWRAAGLEPGGGRPGAIWISTSASGSSPTTTRSARE